MKKRWVTGGWLLALALTGAVSASETVEAKIVKLDVFKNGVGVVTYAVKGGNAAADGVYCWPKPPQSLNGTFYLSGDPAVVASIQNEKVAVPLNTAIAGYAELFGNLPVKVVVARGDETVTLSGTVLAPELPETGEIQPYELQNRLLLSTADGVVALNQADIREIYASQVNQQKMAWRGVMNFQSAKPLEVAVHTLSEGVAWSPAYTIDLVAKDRMKLTQSAVVRNEIADFADAEVRLVSGFPNMVSRSVGSLMNPGMTLADFLQQLGGGDNNFRPVPMMAQNKMMSRGGMMDMAVEMGAGAAELPPDGVDLYFQPVGKLSMKKGESRYFELASRETSYRKLMEWTIPTQQSLERFAYGSPEREAAENDIWECLVFSNPFDFPMTTAPASIYTQGSFSGQSQQDWVNPGRESTLKITKALSIKTEVTERENSAVPRKVVTLNNATLQEITFTDTIALTNYRNEAVEIRVRKQFFGQLVSASDDAKNQVLPQNWRSVNFLNQLEWTVKLEPGAKKELTFDYRMQL